LNEKLAELLLKSCFLEQCDKSATPGELKAKNSPPVHPRSGRFVASGLGKATRGRKSSWFSSKLRERPRRPAGQGICPHSRHEEGLSLGFARNPLREGRGFESCRGRQNSREELFSSGAVFVRRHLLLNRCYDFIARFDGFVARSSLKRR
jgi:hypothetical protein